MANKDALIQVKVTQDQKRRIEAEAKKQDVKVPQYVIEALNFYSAFNVHFLEHIYSVAEKMKLPMPKIIENLLEAYISTDAAIIEVFGTGGKAYKRAFQFDENGLIEGDRLSNLVFEQVKEEISVLRKKLENAVKSKRPVLITRDDAALMAARL